MDDRFPCRGNIDIHVSGDFEAGNESDNLVVKAYNLIAADFDIPASTPISTSAFPSRLVLAAVRLMLLS